MSYSTSIHNLLTKWVARLFFLIALFLVIPSQMFAENNSMIFWSKWSIQWYYGLKDLYWYKLEGTEIFYNKKLVHHFAKCNDFGTVNQNDIDDFCGMVFWNIKSWQHGLYFELSASYPWSYYEYGLYTLSKEWNFVLQATLYQYNLCLYQNKNSWAVESIDNCEYLGFDISINGNLVIKNKINWKTQRKLIKISY